ncbi:MAG TPA: phosphate ABC transporter permease subunit PstC [Bdellovibrionota bacterium]|nr:phosphate ABC transporter permease subunit PstC [Bdellovibrionota bacterium]
MLSCKWSSVRKWRLGERAIIGFLFLCAFVSIVTTLGIVWVLLEESFKFFEHVSIFEFVFGREWTPMFEPKQFGVLPLVSGTMLIAVGAAVVAIPLGLLSALYLSEYAPNHIRIWLKPILEILAGIPTVVYGYFALTFVTPILRKFYPQTNIFNAASAAIVVGIMILPMIASLSDDAMRSVPRALRYAAYALGATKFEVSARVVFPAAFSGIMASFVLALSRAIGETMAVTLAAGATPKLTANFFESIQTMTAYIVQVSLGDTPAGSIEYQTIFAVGLGLFVITLIMNIFAVRLLERFREVYD